jgi:hypothetical protein
MRATSYKVRRPSIHLTATARTPVSLTLTPPHTSDSLASAYVRIPTEKTPQLRSGSFSRPSVCVISLHSLSPAGPRPTAHGCEQSVGPCTRQAAQAFHSPLSPHRTAGSLKIYTYSLTWSLLKLSPSKPHRSRNPGLGTAVSIYSFDSCMFGGSSKMGISSVPRLLQHILVHIVYLIP